MTSGSNPLENEAANSEKAPENGALTDLEQHISQRINRLADPEPGESTHLQLEIDEAESSFLPPFEPADPYDLSSITHSEHFSKTYTNLRSRWEGSEELLKAVHDLNDLLTESILSLNVRLTTLEENLAEHSEERSLEIKKTLKDFRGLLQAVKAPSVIASTEGSQISDMSQELQQQLQVLEGRLQQMTRELEHKIEKRQLAFGEQLRLESKVLETMLQKDRQTSQRHFFSLAVLFIIVIFAAGALMTNSVDRLSSFFSQQQDALHIQLEQILAQPGKN